MGHNENLDNHYNIPDWICGDYFKNIFDKTEPSYANIKHFTAKPAIPPGENYTSIMLRISITLEMKDGSTKEKRFILKTMLDDEKGGAAIKEMTLFPKEMLVYQKYMPAFETLYKNKGLDIQLGPKCYFCEAKDARITLVFEDLAERHFTMVDRTIGCDFAHMVHILQKLAEFHAASAVYEDLNGPYPDEFHRGFASKNEKEEFQRKIFQTRVPSFKKALRLWNLKEAETYIKNFPTYAQYQKSARRTLDTSQNFFNVLSHGDFWSSNVMQSYKANGNIKEVLLVDYQFCNWNSPAQDLIMFISISAMENIRLKEFEHFIQIYYERLIECLELLEFKKSLPKLRDLQMSMYNENMTFFVFLSIVNHLAIILQPQADNLNMEILLAEGKEADAFRMRIYLYPPFVRAMRDLYPFYYNRGLLNFQDI